MHIQQSSLFSTSPLVFLLATAALLNVVWSLSLEEVHSSMNRLGEDDDDDDDDSTSLKRALYLIELKRQMLERDSEEVKRSLKRYLENLRNYGEQENQEEDESLSYPPSVVRLLEGLQDGVLDEEEERRAAGYDDDYDEPEFKKKSDGEGEDRKKKMAKRKNIFDEDVIKPKIFQEHPSLLENRDAGNSEDINRKRRAGPEEFNDLHLRKRRFGRQQALITRKRQINTPSDYRASELGHRIMFWDPSPVSSDGATYASEDTGEDKKRSSFADESLKKRQTTKKRYSDDEENHNKHLQVWKREEKQTSGKDDKILGELSEIFQDGNEKKKKKRDDTDVTEDKRIPPDVKRESDKSDESKEEEEEKDKSGEKLVDAKKQNSLDNEKEVAMPTMVKANQYNNKQSFYDWLQKEYAKTMARSMASTKRKRSDYIPMVYHMSDDPRQKSKSSTNERSEKMDETIQTRIAAGELGEDERDHKERTLDDFKKIKLIEKMLMNDALSLIKDRAKAKAGEDATADFPDDHMTVSYDKNVVRGTIRNLERALAGMGADKDIFDGVDQRRKKNPYEERSRLNLPSLEECPSLRILTDDCSILDDLIPMGDLKESLLQMCNWHELCYTCGEAYGMGAEDCDGGFMEESETMCVDDAPCRTSARMMLLPLRQRRVFFKRSIPDMCFSDPCVSKYLQRV